MPNLLLEEVCGPSHEDIMASNVLAFLSSSGINSERFPVQKIKELSSSEPDCARFLLQESKSYLNNSISSSRSSSDSMRSFRNSMKGDFFMGFDPVSHNFSDLDDDGLHGDRMKPLSSLENNCEMRSRFSMSQFSKRKGSNSPANSKVLAAARVGRRARHKAHRSDNKENLIMVHMKEMQETCRKHKGVKRKSAGHEGNARFLVLKRKRSTSSSWQTMTCVPRITPSVSNVAATASVSNCKEMRHLTKSPQRTISSSTQAAHPLLGAPHDAEDLLGKKIVSQESAHVVPPCSTFACPQSSGLPLPDSREESSSSSRAHPSGKEQLSFTKGDNLMGIPCTKPPTYPKAKQSMSTIHNGKCGSHVVGASCSKKTGVAEFHDQASMNEAQRSTSKVMEMQCGYAKIEEGTEDLAGHERAYHVAAGTNVGDASLSSAGSESCNPHMEICKLLLSDPRTQTHAGPSLSMPRGNDSDSPCLPADKVIVLTQPLRIVNAPTVSNSGAIVKLAEVKQETSSQDSSTRDHVKDSARKHNALDLPSQLRPKDHPRTWGIPLYRQSQHNNVGLRRGRPPRKSNLCPCPEPKEHPDKFARICAPSGILGKLNPGIITRLRDKKQVHAVLEAVVRGAFMTGMKANLKLQRAKEAEDADAYQGVRSEEKDKAAGCRERTLMKEEPCLPEHAMADVNLLKGGSLLMSPTYSRDLLMDIHEVSEAYRNKDCSVEALGDQKVLDYNISNAATTAENATGNVASCWLELLRLDIKGRLSALKRSRRRVRGVIVSGQLDTSKVKANQADQMEKWRAFFVHMEDVLCSEGTRLESWLNQITQMQTSYCQKKMAASDMPPLCGMDIFNVEMDGASR